MSVPKTARLIATALAASVALLVGPAAVPASASVSGNYELAVQKATNAERSKRNLSKLKHRECLDNYAEAQARRMAKKKKLYHQSLKPILKKCKLSAVGENVAYGYSSGKKTTNAWMKSPGHKANIVNKRYTKMGIGAYRDSKGRWWVAQVLGRPR